MLELNNNGYTLITVLLLILLLTILGGAYIFVMNFEVSQSYQHDSRVQAYYYARSGAEVGYHWLKQEGYLEGNKVLEETVFQGCLNEGFELVEEPCGNTTIKINLKSEDDKIKVSATAFLPGVNVQEEVRLILEKSGGGGGDGPFVGVCSKNEIYIFDGSTWNKKYPDEDETIDRKADFESVAWNGEELVLVGERKANNPNLFATYDMEEWVGETLSGGGSNHLKNIIWIEEKGSFFAINHNGRIFQRPYSSDEWELIANTHAGNKTRRMESAYGQNTNTLVMVDEGNSIYYYDFNNGEDGRINLNYDFKDVAFGNGLFIAVGEEGWNDDGVMYKSNDGKNWTRINLSGFKDGDAFQAITWTGEKFVAVGDYDTVLISSDGNDWNEVDRNNDIEDDPDNITTGIRRHFSSVVSSGELILATSQYPTVKDWGTTLVSEDGGATWIKYENEHIPEIEFLGVIGEEGAGAIPSFELKYWE